MFKTVTHPDFGPSSVSGSRIPMEQGKVQLARIRAGRAARIAKWSGLVGMAFIIAGALIIVNFTDGTY
ncbi:hypothetical protein [Gymnodinialimonas ulvae]|uniref:hypothetical protein n=1 Tax=Gymnodinialimonas ulvae TaxID=3126504 RepID=UPI0030ED8013